jgi:hypothetical protein
MQRIPKISRMLTSSTLANETEYTWIKTGDQMENQRIYSRARDRSANLVYLENLTFDRSRELRGESSPLRSAVVRLRGCCRISRIDRNYSLKAH